MDGKIVSHFREKINIFGLSATKSTLLGFFSGQGAFLLCG